MDFQDLKELVGAYPAGYIKFKANQILQSFRYTAEDIEDIEQELIMHVYFSKPNWDKSITWNSWVRIIVDRRICGMIDEWKAKKRGYGAVSSFDFSETEGMFKDKWYRNFDFNLPLDIERFIETLPDNMVPYAVALQALNGVETASVLGVSTSTVLRYKNMLRELMTKEGLEKYLS